MELKKVQIDDLKILFDWRNDNETVKNSISQKKLLFKDHKAWFLKNYKNPFFYILTNNSEQIGQIRFDQYDYGLLLNYSIGSSFRGKGYGKKIIELGLKQISFNSIVIAKVLKTNIASINILKSQEFKIQEEDKNLIIFIREI